MGDLTANLSRGEFACPCIRPECNRTMVDFELVNAIQACADHFFRFPRDHAGKNVFRIAIHINSGHRCSQYDREMKLKNSYDFNSKKASEHIWGIAADHWMEYVFTDGTREKVSDNLIADWYEKHYIGRCGIGRYKNRTHLDFREGHSARWDNR